MKELYKGKYFHIIEKSVNLNGNIINFEIAERAPGVRLLFINPDGKILLSKEFRRESDGRDYRLPGGKVFDHIDDYISFMSNNGDINQEAKKIAKKESKEETGIIVNDCDIIYIDHVGASINRDLFYILIKDYDDNNIQQELEEGEHITTQRYTPQEVLDIMNSGQMGEGRTKGFLYSYLLNNLF